MSADLQSNSMFARNSFVLMDDSLIRLEHGYRRDRIRRFMYDSIQSVIIWRRVPLLHVLVCFFLLVLPGFGILFIDEPGIPVVGAIVMMIGGALIAWYLYCRHTTIRIVRASKIYDVSGIFRPGKLWRFRDRLIAGIRRAQSAEVGPGAG